MASFWEQHEASERELALEARLPQDAPMTCSACGHHGRDVLLGFCETCAPTWQPEV